jgi:hypothetical protein
MTDDQRITRVLACCGKAPRSAWAFDDAERAAVAALCGDDGFLVVGGQEAFRLLMVEHYERRKATSAEFDKIAASNQQSLDEWQLEATVYDAADEPPPTEGSE